MKRISEIVESEQYKTFMKYLYGWGAAVVLMGALFKIQHWPGASLMLIVGMGVEVFIFFFSAFEPLHADLDWTLVYPELAGIEEEDEAEQLSEAHDHSGKMKGKEKDDLIRSGVTPAVQMNEFKGIKKLEIMMEGLEVNTDLFATLGEGLNKLNQTTANLSDLSEATVATDDYVTQVKNATSNLTTLSDSYVQSKEALYESVGALSGSYQNTANLINQTGEEVSTKFKETGLNLLSNYTQLADSIKLSADTVSTEAKNYSAKIDSVNKNLSALNTVYELQLKETNQHLKNTEDIFGGFAKMMNNLKESAEATSKYRDEVAKLSDSVAELNGIYGNMLSSLNFVNK
jgi:gliding motility-associated protein GldL